MTWSKRDQARRRIVQAIASTQKAEGYLAGLHAMCDGNYPQHEQAVINIIKMLDFVECQLDDLLSKW